MTHVLEQHNQYNFWYHVLHPIMINEPQIFGRIIKSMKSHPKRDLFKILLLQTAPWSLFSKYFYSQTDFRGHHNISSLDLYKLLQMTAMNIPFILDNWAENTKIIDDHIHTKHPCEQEFGQAAVDEGTVVE